MSERRRTLGAGAAALLSVLLAGCGETAAPDTATPGAGSSGARDVVVSADPADRRPYPAAIVSGRLTLQDGCLALDGLPTLWPAGSAWDADSQTVVLSDGARLAVGDRIRVGGGLVPGSVASEYGESAQAPIDACLRTLEVDDMALISGVVE